MELPTFGSNVLLEVQGQTDQESFIMLVQGQLLEEASPFILCVTLNLKMKYYSPSKRQERRTQQHNVTSQNTWFISNTDGDISQCRVSFAF
jgi:hypothetical protein